MTGEHIKFLLLLAIVAIVSTTDPKNGNIFIHRETIYRMNFDGSNQTEIPNSYYGRDSIDFSWTSGKLFLTYCDPNYGYCQVVTRDLTSSTPIDTYVERAKKDWRPQKSVIDYIGNKLYVLDRNIPKISIFDLRENVTFKSYISLNGLIETSQLLTLAPEDGLLFVSSINDKVYRMNMDGTSPTLMKLPRERSHYAGLEVNNQAKRLFFISDDKIKSVNYNGTDERIAVEEVGDPISFSTRGDLLYWVSSRNVEPQLVHYCKLTAESRCLGGSRKQFSVGEGLQSEISWIKIVNDSPDPTNSPCHVDNGYCEHLCLLTAGSDGQLAHSCACAIGFDSASPDSKKCLPIKEYFIYRYDGVITSLSYNTNNTRNFALYPTKSSVTPQKIDYDFEGNQVYFSGLLGSNNYGYHSSICRRQITGPTQQVCMKLEWSPTWQQFISFDWVTKNLYYLGYASVNVASFRGIDPSKDIVSPSNRTKNLQRVSYPQEVAGLVVHPTKGFVFYAVVSDTKLVEGALEIFRMNSDGSNSTSIKAMKGRLDDPTLIPMNIDFESGRLYWFQQYERRQNIYHSKLDGSDFQSMSLKGKPLDYVTSIVIKDDNMFITNRHEIIKVKLSSGDRSSIFGGSETEFYDTRIWTNSTQGIKMSNPCESNNGGCPSFCFAVPKTEDGNSFDKVCASAD